MFHGVRELHARTCVRGVGEVLPCCEEVPPGSSRASRGVERWLSRVLAKALGGGS